MATYKGIQGYSVQKLSEDPATLGNVVGQLWYNSGVGKFKVGVQAAGAWASGGNLNTARNVPGQGGTTTAAVCFGGNVPPVTNKTETYDGSSWTEVNTLTTARMHICGFGTSGTAVVAASGNANPPVMANCETYNGTSWTEVNDLNYGGISRGGAGTSTAGLACSGMDVDAAGSVPWAGACATNVEEWDGTNWTNGTAMNTCRKAMAGFGIQTAAIMAGGVGTPAGTVYYDLVEEWNGTSWTEVNDLNTGRAGFSGAGIQTDGMVFGGHHPVTIGKDETELWNGSSWTEVADMATGRSDLPGCGASQTTTAALASGGYTTTFSAATEEWDGAPVTAKIVTVS